MKCIICHQTKIVDYSRAGQNYLLKRCQNCDYIFDPQPLKNLEPIYNQRYYINPEIKGGYSNYFEESTVNKLTFRYRLKKIEQAVKSRQAKLLDLGCALGDFLEVATNMLWTNIKGVDISDYAVKQCRQKGLIVYKLGNNQTASSILKPNSFDVITLQDVIEHYDHPEIQIEQIRGFLKPGGLLFLTTPDTSSLSLKLLGKHWYHFKPTEHITYFNQTNIAKFLIKHKFTNITVKPTPSWVTIQYLIDRIHYYFPKLSANKIKSISQNPLCQIAFPIYTGEMEVWAYKHV